MLLISLFTTCCLAPKVQAQVAIVANKSVQVSDLDIQALIDIFSLENSEWKDGTHITPVDFKGKNEIKKVFYNFLGRSANDIKRDRLRIILAGEGNPPLTASTAKEILNKVVSTAGAIGYAPLEMVQEDEVKIIKIIDQ